MDIFWKECQAFHALLADKCHYVQYKFKMNLLCEQDIIQNKSRLVFLHSYWQILFFCSILIEQNGQSYIPINSGLQLKIYSVQYNLSGDFARVHHLLLLYDGFDILSCCEWNATAMLVISTLHEWNDLCSWAMSSTYVNEQCFRFNFVVNIMSFPSWLAYPYAPSTNLNKSSQWEMQSTIFFYNYCIDKKCLNNFRKNLVLVFKVSYGKLITAKLKSNDCVELKSSYQRSLNNVNLIRNDHGS